MPTYAIAADQTRLSFAVRGLLRTQGEFTRIAGTVTTDEHGNPQSLEVTIPARSLSTGLSLCDLHLKTASFLDVRRYPLITYSSQHLEHVGPGRFVIYGLLSLHGWERPVRLEAVLEPDGGPDGRDAKCRAGQYASHVRQSRAIRSCALSCGR